MTAPIDPAAFTAECAPAPADAFIRCLQQAGFSAAAYRDAYSDLPPTWNGTEALAHFLRYGLPERRDPPLLLDRDGLLALAGLTLHDTALKGRLLSTLARHLLDGVGHPFGPALAERWPAIAALTRYGARPYFLAGDDHSAQYAVTGERDGAWLLPLHLLCPGGTIERMDSLAGYGPALRQAIHDIAALPGSGSLPLLIQFGQLDLEFVHHRQRASHGQRALDIADYQAFCDATLQRYVAHLLDLFGPGDRLRVCVAGVFPPAMSDAAWRAGAVDPEIARRESQLPLAELSAHVRGLQVASLAQRTAIHAQFNAGLRLACRRHGFRFVDGLSPYLGDGGVIDARYVVPEAQGTSYRLDARRTVQQATTSVWHCLDAVGPPRL